MNRPVTLIFLTSCATACLAQLPATAKLAADNLLYKVYINEEKAAADEWDLPVSSLWVEDLRTGSVYKLFTTDKRTQNYQYDYTEFTPLDSVKIPDVYEAKFFPYADSRLIVNGSSPSFTFTVTYLIDLDRKSIVGIPVSDGVIGFTFESGFAVGNTHDYYSGGGRYDVIILYDYEGREICRYSLKNKKMKQP